MTDLQWVVTLSLIGAMIPLTNIIHVSLTSLTLTPPDGRQAVASSSKMLREITIERDAPILMFRQTTLGDTYGKLAFINLNHMDAPPTVVNLRCERVHFAAARGVCLTARRGVVTTYQAIIFNSSFQPLHAIPLGGTPSRVRVSPDGRMAAVTVFVSGHAYAATGFSTRTSILDLEGV